MAGAGSHVETDDTVIKLGGEVESLDRLRVLIRCGWSLCQAAHMRWIVRSRKTHRPGRSLARPVSNNG